MTKKEAVMWLKNLQHDLRNSNYKNLWCYKQAIEEIVYLIEFFTEPKSVVSEMYTITKEQHDAELAETTMKLKEINASLNMTNEKLAKELCEMKTKIAYKDGAIYGLKYALRGIGGKNENC